MIKELKTIKGVDFFGLPLLNEKADYHRVRSLSRLIKSMYRHSNRFAAPCKECLSKGSENE